MRLWTFVTCAFVHLCSSLWEHITRHGQTGLWQCKPSTSLTCVFYSLCENSHFTIPLSQFLFSKSLETSYKWETPSVAFLQLFSLFISFSFRCQCAAGFTGPHCELNINECHSNPCRNQATCVDKLNSYSCKCRPGFSGSRCETGIYDLSVLKKNTKHSDIIINFDLHQVSPIYQKLC